jgi:hypothetical protein
LSTIPALGKLRQKGHEFQARLCQNQNKTKKANTNKQKEKETDR